MVRTLWTSTEKFLFRRRQKNGRSGITSRQCPKALFELGLRIEHRVFACFRNSSPW
jgi:hypothetical protein